jgi:phospholipid/cholesterol/gamma-HCH transport system substrate-binding protein
MAFKVTNETKIGALAAVSITLLILGFNFLKGKSYSSKTFLYAKFKSVDGLLVSNPVIINGFQVGTVNEITEADQNMDYLLVQIKITKDVLIPNTSLATVKTSPLGTPALEIKLDTIIKQPHYFATGDTINTFVSPGLLDGLTSKLDPITDSVKITMSKLNNVLESLNSVLDPNTKGNMQSVIANTNAATANLVKSTASLNELLNTQTGALAKSLDNVQVLSKTLADGHEKIAGIIDNLQKTTENLSKMEVDKTVRKLNDAVATLQNTLNKVNSTDGTLGALINDKKMYNNLNSSVNSLNILLQDVRLHPKRYVNISVFGKKNTSEPLMKPLLEDSVTQEQKLK